MESFLDPHHSARDGSDNPSKRPRRSYTLKDKQDALKYWLTPSIPHEPPSGRLRHPTLDEVSAALGIPNSTLSGWRTSEEEELVVVKKEALATPNVNTKALGHPPFDPGGGMEPAAGCYEPREHPTAVDYPPPETEALRRASRYDDEDYYSVSPESDGRCHFNPSYRLSNDDPLWDVVATDHISGKVSTPSDSLAAGWDEGVWG